MDSPSPLRQPKSSDLQCLRCGAMNIPENHVCGRCGASLPVVYDDEGKVLSFRETPRIQMLMEQQARRRSTLATGMIFRLLVILGAIVFAFWMLHHH